MDSSVARDFGGRIIPEHDQAMALAVGRAMDKSAKLLRAAAEAGDSEAQFALALLNLLGRGVERNAGEAFRLFGLASDAGDEQAASFRDMAAEQMARAQIDRQLLNDAAVHVMKEAKRRQRFPKPRIVASD
jgi:TPR repeat protein